MGYIKGIDISNNDGNIDFSKVAGDGVEYVYVKATEGETFQDSTMEGFYNAAKAQGLKVGAYHFLVGTSTPEAQAQNFYNKIKDLTWDLVPMMDVETSFDSLSDYVTRFIAAFKQLSTLTLGIYSYTSFLPSLTDIQNTIKDMPFWEANYNNDPWNLPSNFFTNRAGHQYTETGTVDGISENCDIDSFNDGVLLKGAWVQDSTGWWYKYPDGTYPKEQWLEIDGKWYYFKPDGYMCTGWLNDGGNWYYLWSNGQMAIGWIELDGRWYYLNPSGVMLTGWQWIDGECYCFDSKGALYVDTTTPDGYKVDETGAWVQ
jgi:GH25 family lysozyme M1 (1,4-beta-N-acetylmuramidase)